MLLVLLYCHNYNLDNALQTAVLNLFVSLKYRFANLIVGWITRESVKRALNNGITAEQVRTFLDVKLLLIHCIYQIISYLTTHAHPQMRKNVRDILFRVHQR